MRVYIYFAKFISNLVVNPYLCRMQDITLTVLFPLQVKVFRPMYGADRIEILVNMMREGTMHKRNGIWIADLLVGSILTSADISIIGDMLDDQEKIEP